MAEGNGRQLDNFHTVVESQELKLDQITKAVDKKPVSEATAQAFRDAFTPNATTPDSQMKSGGFGEKVDNVATYRAHEPKPDESPTQTLPTEAQQEFAAKHTKQAFDVFHQVATTDGADNTTNTPVEDLQNPTK